MTGTVLFVREPAAIYFSEPGGAEVAERIAGHRLAAPEIVDYEIANVGMNKVRCTVMPGAAAIADFLELRLDRHAVAPDDAFDTALRHDFSAYDATYLHLALTSVPVRGFLVSATSPGAMALPPGVTPDLERLRARQVLLQHDPNYVETIAVALRDACAQARTAESEA